MELRRTTVHRLQFGTIGLGAQAMYPPTPITLSVCHLPVVHHLITVFDALFYVDDFVLLHPV